jgi:hypothetical protein
VEAIHETVISFPVSEQAVEVEPFERVFKAHQTVALTNGNSRLPDGNQSVLAACQPELGMTQQLKKNFPFHLV